MPEMHFNIRWPDASVSSCYSPSLVMKKYVEVGQRYPVEDFVRRCREGLNLASDRVKAHFGHPCSIAARQLQEIEHKAGLFAEDPSAMVEVTGFTD